MKRPLTLAEIEKRIVAAEKRLDGHSRFLVNEVKEDIDRLRLDLHKLLISNDRFTELERSVADVAMVVYDRKTRRKADSRVRPN